MRAEADREAQATVDEGTALASAAGLQASPRVLEGLSPWRELSADAGRAAADVLVCGTEGAGVIDRAVLGCTASSLLHHADRPLLVVPAVASPELDGPVLAGFDGSDGARLALAFASEHLSERRLIVAHAWRSPVRHSLRGHALTRSGVDTFEDYAAALDAISSEIAQETAAEGANYARELGLEADPDAPESGYGDWHALLHGARAAGAYALLVGTRGRGAVASTVLGLRRVGPRARGRTARARGATRRSLMATRALA
jgi:nucleotide-binding universal stress UspA family protein